MTTTWDTVAIVGVGLIGGSIGMALRGRGQARRIVGIGRRKESLQRALELDAVTEITTDLEQGVREAELTVVCSPVDLIPPFVRRVAASCPASSVITDAGSTKASIVQRVADGVRADGARADGARADGIAHVAPFVGSHPLAGSEKTGVAHARGDLFLGCTAVVTPTDQTPADATDRIQAFWTGLGANVVTLTAAQHDAAVATTSHLPHLIASALAAATPEEFRPLIGTGWLDTTRIAAGDVELWRQILRQNRQSVLQALEQFEKVLNSFTLALQQQDDAAVTELLSTGKQRRDALAD